MTKLELYLKLVADQRWLERAILAIDARQTPTERAALDTRDDNGRGWTKGDAKFMGKLGRWIRNSDKPEGTRLYAPHVLFTARKRIRKYCGQLLRCIEERKQS